MTTRTARKFFSIHRDDDDRLEDDDDDDSGIVYTTTFMNTKQLYYLYLAFKNAQPIERLYILLYFKTYLSCFI